MKSKNWAFKTKLILLCIFSAGITAVIGVTSYWGLNKVIESYGAAADVALPNMTNLADMRVQYREIRINLRTLGIPGLSKEQAQEAIENVHQSIEKYTKAEQLYTSVNFQPGEKELFDDLKKNWENFKLIGGKALSYYESSEPGSKEKLLGIFLKDCPEAAHLFTEAMDKLLVFQKDFAKSSVEQAHSASSRSINLMLIIGIMGILLGLSIGWIFSSSISKNLSHLASSLGDNATQLASASTQIAGSSQKLSQATTQQAASLEETATALEEISSMIARAAESAKSTSESSQLSHEKAQEGRTAVDTMMNSMQEISESNEAIMAQISDSNEKMTEIVKVIQEIGNKTKVINEIVFQTKLLSFNASVEAARAGEHGKGFAVVAEEVGNLAQMSGNAAKEISDLLDSSVSRVESIVVETKSKVENLFDQGKQKIQTGLGLANQCSEILNEIVSNVSKVSSLAQEISQAAQEQTQGVSEINKAMGELDVVTQQNSSGSQETAASAETLAGQSESLKTSVEELIVIVQGGKAA